MAVPNWVHSSIFYQIFPDRFENSNIKNDPPNVVPWLSSPTLTGFHGGDLAGIFHRLDYLKDLGIDALYLNPIFLSSSTHRYNTADYYRIDPKLGTNEEFDQFLNQCHQNGFRIILDGVFNHCGRGFFAFNDVLENQFDSPYKDWFHITRFPVEAYGPGDATTYEGWWRFKSLPKLNISNPDVRKYILDVARYWINKGIDGWRLDVPNEIDDDAFWEEFRYEVKLLNPEAYLLGEIWDGNRRWVGDTHFDGLMNYPVRSYIIDLLMGRINSIHFVNEMNRHFLQYPSENIPCMYNLLGSHDTERLMTMVGEDKQKAKLSFLILISLPGAPAVFYGDEIGLTGGVDPDCRKAFPWDQGLWNHELRHWVRDLIRIRKENRVFSDERFRFSVPDQHSEVIQLTRVLRDEEYYVFINPTDQHCEIGIIFERDGVFFDLLKRASFRTDNLRAMLIFEPWSGVILKRVEG